MSYSIVTYANAYIGACKKERTTGVKQWCKLVMHTAKVCLNPITGKPMPPRTAVDDTVELFVSDSGVEEIIAAVKEKGVPMPDVKDGYKILGKDLPEQYQFAFTEDGARIAHCYVDFGETRKLVKPDGKDWLDANGRCKHATSVRVSYWTGGDADEDGSILSKEYRIRRALKEWKSLDIPLPTINVEANKESQEQAEEKAEEAAAEA